MEGGATVTKKPDCTVIEFPHAISPEVRALFDRWEYMSDTYEQLLRDAIATGNLDRARLRDCLALYGAIRRDLLTALGEDPDSEDLVPLPVQLDDM